MLSAGFPIRALNLHALGVQIQRVLADLESAFVRDFGLALFDLGIEEFFDAPALQAHQMVVVPALVELEDRFPRLEMVADQEYCVLELRQHAVNGGKPDV